MNPSSQAETPRPEALFLDSTSLLGNPEALRRRAQEEGYLFFRGLLPQSDLLDLRGELLEVVERHGWRKPGQDRLGGAMDLERLTLLPEAELRTDIGVSIAAYQDAQRLERLHRLPHHPHLLELYSTLFGGDVLVHPRHIQIRLSMDVRYQSAAEPIEQKSLQPHCDLSWEQIYADWQHDDLKYYWRKGELELAPWDDHYLQPSSRIC